MVPFEKSYMTNQSIKNQKRKLRRTGISVLTFFTTVYVENAALYTTSGRWW